MNKLYIIFISVIILTLSSCDDNIYPRPKGQLRLEYPEASYSRYHSDHLHASFEKSNIINIEVKSKDWINMSYPNMKARIHITYKDINHNTNKLIDEVQKMTYKHTIKASGIIENPYSNPDKHTYGTLFEVKGDAASNLQFYITDSTKHMVSGALYFFVTPNADSLAPAVDYIKKDITTLMETIEWDK